MLLINSAIAPNNQMWEVVQVIWVFRKRRKNHLKKFGLREKNKKSTHKTVG